MPEEEKSVHQVEIIRLRGKLGAAVREGLGEDVITGYRRDLAVAMLTRDVHEVLASDHAPTPEQRATLAQLLTA